MFYFVCSVWRCFLFSCISLVRPIPIQMKTCVKCSQKFCSSFNYSRHVQGHRQTFNANKEAHRNRQLLAEFWDKLSLEEAKDIISFDDVTLKGLPGSTILEVLADLFNLQEARSLTQDYANAGFVLLAILRAKPSLPPIPSQELFNVLDGASEKTFLCSGTAVVEKYYYVEEDKLLLAVQDLIAITSFFVEKQLTKAWVAEKDAEALRCHKLLVEEEEAAQKRQAKISRRNWRKKQRQKQKSREHLNKHNGDFNIAAAAQESEPQIFSDMPSSAQESAPQNFSDSISETQDVPQNSDSVPKYLEPQSNEPLDNTEAQEEHIKPKMVSSSRQRCFASNRCHEANFQRERSRFHARNSNVSRNKLNPIKDRATGGKVWRKKLNVNRDKEASLKPHLVQEDTCKEEKCSLEMMIGSIPVTVKSSVNKYRGTNGDKNLKVHDKEESFKSQILQEDACCPPEEEKSSCILMIGSISISMRSSVNKQQQDKSGNKKLFVKTSSDLSDAPRKLEAVNKLKSSKDEAAPKKVLIKKLNFHNKEESLKSQIVQKDTCCTPGEEKGSCALMIGSISVAMKSNLTKQQQDKRFNTRFSLKFTKNQPGAIVASTTHLSRGETKSTALFGKENKFMEERIDSSLQLQSTNNSKDDEILRGNLPLSRTAAIEFLARRWEVANSSDHVVWKRMST